MNKLVSIIMGVYNCEDTLRESVDSILAQTYDNWEFIICDDGSKDDTLKISEEYAEKYPGKFLVLKNKKNLGLNATLNRCIQAAKGDYIARQDGDDISVSTRFAKEVDFLEKNTKYAFVSTNMSFFDEQGIWGETRNIEKPGRQDFFRQSPCFCHAPCMIRKEAFLDVKGYTEKERYLRCEDVNLWYKLYAKGYKGYNIQEKLYLMRDDKNAFKRRTIKNRVNLILTEWDGMRSLKCSFIEYRFFVKKAVKNIILAIMPQKIYAYLHKMKLNNSMKRV